MVLSTASWGYLTQRRLIVNVFSGLEVHPDNAELLNGLKIARVSVLDDLLELDEPEPLVIRGYEDSEPSPPMQRALVPLEPAPQRVTDRDGTDLALVEANHESPPGSRAIQDQSAGSRVATVFESKFERIMGHLGLEKIARLAVVYTVTELLNLRRVSVGLGLFFLALLAQMVMHRHKLMVVSMLVVCFYRSVLKAKALALIVRWGHTSTDKLGAFTWMPRVVCVVPVVLKVIGQAKFMLFLHQDLMLSVLVASVTSILVANSRRGDAGPHAVAWGQGRHLKFAAYGTAIAYWAGYRGNVVDTLRLAAPALMDAAGIVLGSVQPDEVQECCRRAWKRLYSEIADDIQQDVDLDALFFLGLGNWVVEYWQQPTDFSIEMLARMMAESFAKLEKAAVSVFRPELNRLSEQIADNRMSSELSVLVKYLKQSLSEIPPPRWFGMMGLFAMRCPSFVALGILVVFFGVISLPLVPFLVVEAHDAQQLYRMHRDGELNDLDGLEIWLLGSPLVLVWANLKASIYCLEGTVTLSRAVATGTHIVTTAARVRYEGDV